MGLSREDFVIMGINLEGMNSRQFEDDDFFEEYREYYRNKKKGDFTLVVDSCGGGYTIFGVVIEHGDGYYGLPLTEIDLDELEQIKEITDRVKSKVKELFGLDCKPKLYALTHWA